MRRVLSLLVAIFALPLASRPLRSEPVGSAAAATTPTIDELISLKRAGSPVISPDGRLVAYTVRETNWDDDRYETEIWIADVASGAVRQLTNAPKSSTRRRGRPTAAVSRSDRTAPTSGRSTSSIRRAEKRSV